MLQREVESDGTESASPLRRVSAPELAARLRGGPGSGGTGLGSPPAVKSSVLRRITAWLFEIACCASTSVLNMLLAYSYSIGCAADASKRLRGNQPSE